VELIVDILESHMVRTITGEELGGGALTNTIMGRINNSDALIALITPGEQRLDGSYTPHTWVRDELNYARGRNKRAISLLQQSILPEGAWQEHEYIKFDPANLLPALRRLVKTIGQWKKEDGRLVKVMLLPEEVGTKVVLNKATCKYRFFKNGRPSEWKKADVVGEVGGSFAFIFCPYDDSLLEIRTKIGRDEWGSKAFNQFIPANFKKATARRP